MAYVTEIASGATVLDVADKDLYALRTQANANKLFGVNSDGTGVEVKELKTLNNSSLVGSGNVDVKTIGGASIFGSGDIPTGFVGQVVWCSYTAQTVPSGYLLCNGAAVSRTTYAALFAVIGTTYGSGDGSTTFNLPNLTDKFIQGSGTAGTSKSASGRIKHYHVFGYNNGDNGGSFLASRNGTSHENVTGGYRGWNGSGGGGWYETGSITGNMITSYDIDGSLTSIQPPAVTMLPLIKY